MIRLKGLVMAMLLGLALGGGSNIAVLAHHEMEQQRREQQQPQSGLGQQRTAQASRRSEVRQVNTGSRGYSHDFYGSIAVSRNSSGSWGGIAWGQSAGPARQKAIDRCNSDPRATACEEIARFSYPCGAVYVGRDDRLGTGAAETEGAANDMARAHCEAVDGLCQRLTSGCRIKLDDHLLDYFRELPGEVQWGALATSLQSGGGYAWAIAKHPETKRADSEALDDCRAAGGSSCRITGRFKGCLALFVSFNGTTPRFTHATGQTFADARNRARYQCRNTSNSCILLANQCTGHTPLTGALASHLPSGGYAAPRREAWGSCHEVVQKRPVLTSYRINLIAEARFASEEGGCEPQRIYRRLAAHLRYDLECWLRVGTMTPEERSRTESFWLPLIDSQFEKINQRIAQFCR